MTLALTIDHKPFTYTVSHLPCLISGVNRSGASYLSIVLAAQLILQGYKVIFFTAFPAGKEELLHHVPSHLLCDITNSSDIAQIPQDKSIVVPSGNYALLQELVQHLPNIADYIIFIKNIEEYEVPVIDIIKTHKHSIVSGNIDMCSETIIDFPRSSTIWFNQPKTNIGYKIPTLKQYESYFTDASMQGILRLKENKQLS